MSKDSITLDEYRKLVDDEEKRQKEPKYKNRITWVGSIRFHSQGEANRYLELKALEAQEIIHHLELQVSFPFDYNGIRIGSYIADFRYFLCGSNELIIEDHKGFSTPAYRLKKRLMKAFYGIDIYEHREAKRPTQRQKKGGQRSYANTRTRARPPRPH